MSVKAESGQQCGSVSSSNLVQGIFIHRHQVSSVYRLKGLSEGRPSFESHLPPLGRLDNL